MEPNKPTADGELGHPARPLPSADVPVYNCLVLVAPRNSVGLVVVRAANLAGLSAAGKTEREALQALVPAFKAALAAFHERGEPIPWLDPPESPQPGDQQRWIAVHL